MKSFIVAACIVACVFADDRDAQVVRSDYDWKPSGSFESFYETSNGINGQASGVIKPFGKDEVALEITGSFKYISPDGKPVVVTYVANENGFQAQGEHLPTTPAPQPIPEYIQRAIDYIAAHPYVEKKN